MVRIAAIVFCVAGLLRANGVIIPPHPNPPPFPRPPGDPRPWRVTPAAVKDVTLKVEIDDQAARTEVDEVFVNPTPQPLEGTFILPIPPDAQISDFTFWVDGKAVEGEILPRDKAQKYYQDIVARLIDPALLEYMDKGLIRVKIFPIPPHGEAKIRFAYSQVLPSEGEQLTYYYPFGTNKFSSRPLNQAVVDIRVRSSVPLRAIYSPRYEVDVARRGEKEARISLEKKDFMPKEDFVLYVGRSEADFGVTSIPFRTGKEEGYALFIVSPKQEFGPSQFVPKDVVFVLDTSGSMAGEKIEQAKEALSYCVRSLGESDRFNLVQFSTQAQCFLPELADATGENRTKALDFISYLKALGGTNIDEALGIALKQRRGESDRPFMVVFLTDGQPTVGVTDWRQILKNVAGSRPKGLRLFVFGVGDDVNTILLDRLAEENRGTRQYVRPHENLEVRVSSFYQQIARPVLSDVAISFSRGGIYDLYPPRIEDLFYGRQVILVGRYREYGEQVMSISGTCGGKEYGCRFPVTLPESDMRASYLPRLWATRKIGYLLDEIRLHGEKRELIEEVETLAKRFGIVTPYTSYFVHEDKGLVRRGGRSPFDHGWGRLGGAAAGAEGDGVAGAYGHGPPARGREQEAGRPQAEVAGFGRGASAGKEAVDRSIELELLRRATAEHKLGEAIKGGEGREAEPTLKYIGSRTFYLRDGVWEDSTFKVGMEEKKVVYLSPEYFALLVEKPELGECFALGKEVIVCIDGVAYRVTEKS